MEMASLVKFLENSGVQIVARAFRLSLCHILMLLKVVPQVVGGGVSLKLINTSPVSSLFAKVV